MNDWNSTDITNQMRSSAESREYPIPLKIPLNSGASTDAYSVLNPDTGLSASFNWSAFAWANYGGNNPNYEGSYDVKVDVLDYVRRTKGKYTGVMSKSRSLTVRIASPADDCQAYGKASGKHPTTQVKSNTESHIPFP